ncbi:LLM class flavin-dependent oxidoreductase [Streptomyces sp. RS10V-4]|uniref:LLM class flavin-dependent oxidoreductase n=1 Tax=Streptomyces rhizoryzae TaxID=2932493 RepID=UPI002002E61F|nr:LLM class flavin-dependent oxidoreductase [Streptomyces rhizoryzae]MCK7621955.1 LLM class flavin-dependent oxidoreductase [Streptomyces rhizoryzae]
MGRPGYHRFWVSEHHGVPGVAGSAPTVLAAAEGFGAQPAELLGYFTGTRTAHPQVHARPAEGLAVPAFVPATGAGAEVAARVGLALVIGDFRDPAKLLAAVDGYRAAFRPSALWPRPYVVISGTVAVAGSQEAARHLLVPEARALAYARTHGVFPPLRPAADGAAAGDGMSARERGCCEEALRGHVHGTEEQVAAALAELIGASAADEVLVTTSSYDRATLRESFERPARVAGLPRRVTGRGRGRTGAGAGARPSRELTPDGQREPVPGGWAAVREP